jgi:hypothetical protein
LIPKLIQWNASSVIHRENEGKSKRRRKHLVQSKTKKKLKEYYIANHNKLKSPYGYVDGMPTGNKKHHISKTLAVKRHAKTVNSFKFRKKKTKQRQRPPALDRKWRKQFNKLVDKAIVIENDLIQKQEAIETRRELERKQRMQLTDTSNIPNLTLLRSIDANTFQHIGDGDVVLFPNQNDKSDEANETSARREAKEIDQTRMQTTFQRNPKVSINITKKNQPDRERIQDLEENKEAEQFKQNLAQILMEKKKQEMSQPKITYSQVVIKKHKTSQYKIKKKLTPKKKIVVKKKHFSSPLMKSKKLSKQSRKKPILTSTRKEPSPASASKKKIINKTSPKIAVTDTIDRGKKLLQKQFQVDDGVKNQSGLVTTPIVKRGKKKYEKYEKDDDVLEKTSSDLSRKSIYGDLQIKTHFDEYSATPVETVGKKQQQERAETPETPDNYRWNKPILSKSPKRKRIRTPNAVPLPNILTSSSPLLTLRLVKGKLFDNVGKSRPDTAEEDRITPRLNNGKNETDVPLEVINIDSLEYTIGRDITNNCTLDSKRNPKMLSKLHAQIQIEISNMGKPIIQLLDMNSTNGTYVTGGGYDKANLNWTKIKQKPVDLFDGNIIKFGRKRSSDLVYQVDISPTILNDIARLATHNRIGSPLGKVRFLQGGSPGKDTKSKRHRRVKTPIKMQRLVSSTLPSLGISE